ncbi:MAG: ATPase [Sphingobacteriales bacterium]|nr:MAG: ATPase [Sphingobacteriales bacterium]
MRTIRIAITGPESTGKSTLAAQLADALQCPWRPEAARAYLESLDRPYEEADLYQIHQVQQAAENTLLSTRPDFLVLDTEETVLRIWSEEKYHRCDRRILQSLAQHPPDLYLLTGIDLPWEPDPLREHPAPTDRLRLWRNYQDAVLHSGKPWAHLTGPPEQRLQQALQAVQSLSGRRR